MRRKLFVSFTGTMHKLSRGEVTASDLENGLFAFGCCREHALYPGVHGEYVETVVGEYPRHHAALFVALLDAEDDGRVVWRTGPEGNMSYGLVSGLLERNGYARIAAEPSSSTWCIDSYCYPGVRERVEEAGLDVDVVY